MLRRPEREFPGIQVDAVEEEKKVWETYNQREKDCSKMSESVSRGIIELGPGLLKHLHDEVLGIGERDEEWLKAFIARRM